MSDPSMLLLLTCVACSDSTDITHSVASGCSAVEASQPQRPNPLEGKLVNCTHSVSAPEAIPAFLTTASRPTATVQTSATEGAIAPRPSSPESFILPETFTKSPATNSTQSATSSNQASTALDDLPELLRFGSQGEAVSRLQERLQQLEYYTGAIDGIYGQQTFAAVTKFQQAEGLTVDGIAGSLTWTRLQTLLDSAPASISTREATAILSPGNSSQLTNATTEAQTLNQSPQPSESQAERERAANTAGEIAENAPPLEETQAPQTQNTDLEQSLPNQESQQTREFVFDTSPSGAPFYFWIGAWAIVYIGGMLFIFKDGINDKLGLKWGKSDEKDQSDNTLPLFGPSSTMEQFSALDYNQSPESSDGFGPAASHPSEQEKRKSITHGSPLHFSSELDIPSTVEDSSEDAKPLTDSDKPSISSLLEKLAYESLRLSNQELTPAWADGGVVEPIRGLFSDLPHPLGNQPSERRRNRAIASPAHPAPSFQAIKQSLNQVEPPSTLIATLPAEDPETQNSYTYVLLDNAKGYFLLKGNELRVYDEALAHIQSDVDHSITLRRTDAQGTQVDKSFVVNFTKADEAA